jgi:RNA polymerase sigma factor (sigma-70 family)
MSPTSGRFDATPAADGDAAFTAWMAETEPRLRRALVATFGAVEGRQATVDALSWAWEHWDRVRSLDRPVGYLYRVGRTAVRRSAPRPIVDAQVSTTTEIPDVQPELLRALAALPGQQQTVVLLVEAYGWSQQDVADVLGISPSTVHAHLRRALDRLRHTLEASSDAI